MSLLGETIKLRREHLGIGCREAAKAARVSPATISRIERGDEPDIASFAKLCAWLGLPSRMFLDEKGLR